MRGTFKDIIMKNRTFSTGANRNDDKGKIEPEGYLSPLVIKAFSEYMLSHQTLEDGTKRPSDNWQKMFGDDHLQVCMDSAWRHFLDLWLSHRGYKSRGGTQEALGGLLFNIMAYWYKLLKEESFITKTRKDPEFQKLYDKEKKKLDKKIKKS